MNRKLILAMSMSLDGFVAGPNGETDWIFVNRGDDSTAWIVGNQESSGLIIMGRPSYEAMATYWPTSTLPFAKPMNSIPKMVFTRSGVLSPLAGASEAQSQAPPVDQAIWHMWLHPKVGGRDLVGEIEQLKAEGGKPICALGGASFAASLIEHDLVDEYRFIVHPVALGKGISIFDRLAEPLVLRLIECREFKSGAVAKVFEPKRVG